NEAERDAYYQFMRRMLTVLHERLRPVAWLSSNYNYCWQQELARASRDLGVPFVVLHKEGINLSGGQDGPVARYSNGRFGGDLLLAYNPDVARAFARADIAQLDARRIRVVGVPRLDSYVREPRPLGDALVFFSFDLDANVGHLPSFRLNADAL